jgi:hemerythrin-like domain-containing protein
MLRDKNLVPLSHQHQHALALCVRLDRAIQVGDVDPEPWQAEISQIFEQEIALHFRAEEAMLFPSAAQFPELKTITQELAQEHAILRDFFSRAALRTLDIPALRAFGNRLSSHIRKEERQLFEGVQRLMSTSELSTIGKGLEKALAGASEACLLPNEATRLKPRG